MAEMQSVTRATLASSPKNRSQNPPWQVHPKLQPPGFLPAWHLGMDNTWQTRNLQRNKTNSYLRMDNTWQSQNKKQYRNDQKINKSVKNIIEKE